MQKTDRHVGAFTDFARRRKAIATAGQPVVHQNGVATRRLDSIYDIAANAGYVSVGSTTTLPSSRSTGFAAGSKSWVAIDIPMPLT
jgi:hypothetical protein